MSVTRLGHVVAFLLGAIVFGAMGFLVGSSRPDAPGLRPGRPVAAGDEARAPASPSPRRWEPGGAAGATPAGLTEDDRAWMLAALAREKARRQAAEIRPEDTGLAVLGKLLEHGADPEPLFRSFETFARPLRVSPGDEEIIPVTPENVDEVFSSFRRESRSRVVFEFAPGEFTIRSTLHLEGLEFVTLRGAGPDLTMVEAGSEILFSKGVDNLRVADLALVSPARGDGLLDNRGVSAFLVERVRARHFDCGAGHSAVVGITSPGYMAFDDCDFEGGYGRSELSGCAVSLRDRGFVYFRNCRFRELRSFVMATGPATRGSTIKLENCRSRFDFSNGEIAEGVDVILQDTSFQSFCRDDLAKLKIIDRGGTTIEPIADGVLPGLAERVDELPDDVVAVSLTGSLGQGRAIYVKVVRRDGSLTRYFNDPAGRLEPRRIERTSVADRDRPPIKAAEALRIALAAGVHDGRWGDEVSALELDEIELDQASCLVWRVKIGDGPEVRVRADTGVVLPHPN